MVEVVEVEGEEVEGVEEEGVEEETWTKMMLPLQWEVEEMRVRMEAVRNTVLSPLISLNINNLFVCL